MVKKAIPGLVMIFLAYAGTLNLAAAPLQLPICITPAFEFRCFLDNISLPGLLATITATLGVYYVHRSLSSYINRQTTLLPDNRPVPEQVMKSKARNYAFSALAMIAVAATLYWHQSLGIMRLRAPAVINV